MDVQQIVNDCIEKYTGGKKFFDHLDDAVKHDKSLLIALLDLTATYYPRKKLIASGEIGLCLHNFGFQVDVLVNGHLRSGEPIIDISEFVKQGEEYVLIDDSYYSGRTSFAIQHALEAIGCSLVGTCVIYDGHKEKLDNVHSLYRYYNYFDANGNPKEPT